MTKQVNVCKLPRCYQCDTPLSTTNGRLVKNKKENWSPFVSICRYCTVARDKRYKLNPETRKTKFLTAARQRAARDGVPFSITKADINFPELCPILGVRLNYDNEVVAFDSPSLDKVVPSLGYVPGNVAIISHRANTLKGNGTANEHRKIAAWLDTFQTS